MSIRRILPPGLACALALCLAPQGLAQGAVPKTGSSSESAVLKALLRSHELWATIDVCSPKDQKNTVGIRGSMPGDGQAGDEMYMSFRLQFMDAQSGAWVDLPDTAKPSFLRVGPAAAVRQDGSSFQLQPKAGKPAYTLRGVVDFQWRRAGRVIQTAARVTSTGHLARVGADPAGYSAASCLIG
jgi:hypothetical protein